MDKKELKKAGYFFHKGGDLPQTLNMPKKRGIWKRVASPIGAIFIGVSWIDADLNNDR